MTENLHDVDVFIEIYPAEWKREIIVNFRTMETAIVEIELKSFSIGKYPVTNHQYYRFMQESGYYPQDGHSYSYEVFLNHWEKKNGPPAEKGLHPVTFVSYDDTCAYAAHVNGRLPAYHEWLYAALQKTGNKFPWGDAISPDRCNVKESGIGGTTPVGRYSPQGDSPLGCCDMAGNVWEWTSTSFGEGEDILLALGTGWDHYSFQTEIPLDRGYRNRSVGFRVVRDLGT